MIERIDHLIEVAESFGKHGWPLSPELDSAELASLVDAFDMAPVDEKSPVDQIFVAFYEAKNGARIRKILQDLGGVDRMEKWRPIILQTEEALEKKYYALLVPALLTVLEGRVFSKPSYQIKIKKKIKCIVKAQKEDDYPQLVWQTIDDYVDELFFDCSFKGDKPRFNRNWILHGRSPADWVRKDVIRLLHGIHTIDLALSQIPHDKPM